jgi:hypothetical protein
MDVGNWLRNQGLERFEAAFRDNAIDEAVLPHLTEHHLRELGLPLGARIKLLAAIAALTKVAEQSSPAPNTVDAVSADTAERRQITVLFSDLVGSTALSTRMDPEDLRSLISAYQKCVTETVQRFGGFVAKYNRQLHRCAVAPVVALQAQGQATQGRDLTQEVELLFRNLAHSCLLLVDRELQLSHDLA